MEESEGLKEIWLPWQGMYKTQAREVYKEYEDFWRNSHRRKDSYKWKGISPVSDLQVRAKKFLEMVFEKSRRDWDYGESGGSGAGSVSVAVGHNQTNRMILLLALEQEMVLPLSAICQSNCAVNLIEINGIFEAEGADGNGNDNSAGKRRSKFRLCVMNAGVNNFEKFCKGFKKSGSTRKAEQRLFLITENVNAKELSESVIETLSLLLKEGDGEYCLWTMPFLMSELDSLVQRKCSSKSKNLLGKSRGITQSEDGAAILSNIMGNDIDEREAYSVVVVAPDSVLGPLLCAALGAQPKTTSHFRFSPGGISIVKLALNDGGASLEAHNIKLDDHCDNIANYVAGSEDTIVHALSM